MQFFFTFVVKNSEMGIEKKYDWDVEFTGGYNKGQNLSDLKIDLVDVYYDNIIGLNFTDGGRFDANVKETTGLLSITDNAVKIPKILDKDEPLKYQKILRRLKKMAIDSDRVIVLNNDTNERERRSIPYLFVPKKDADKHELATEFYEKLDTPQVAQKKIINKKIVNDAINSGIFIEQIKKGRNINEIIDIIKNAEVEVPEEITQLQKGIEIEQEHKETIEKVQSGEISVEEAIKETAVEHIKENPNYYDELEKIEKPITFINTKNFDCIEKGQYDFSKVDIINRDKENGTIIYVNPKSINEKHFSDYPQFSLYDNNNLIGDRLDRVKKFLMEELPDCSEKQVGGETLKTMFTAPIVKFDDNSKLFIEDGRHRLLVAEQMGFNKFPIQVPKGQVGMFENIGNKLLSTDPKVLEIMEDGNYMYAQIVEPKFSEDYNAGISKNPIYLKNLVVRCENRRKGVGTDMLKKLDAFAEKNNVDIIFGTIAKGSTYNQKEESFVDDIDCIKGFLQERGYVVNEENRDFYKVVSVEKKEETVAEYFGFETPKDVYVLDEQIKDIVSQYGSTPMPISQVNKHLAENRELGKEWLKLKSIDTKEQFDKYIKKLHKEVRKPILEERKQIDNELQRLSTEQHVDNIFALALSESEKMDNLIRSKEIKELSESELREKRETLRKQVELLSKEHKLKYANIDIEQPKSIEEKQSEKQIADLFSQINTIVSRLRDLKPKPEPRVQTSFRNVKEGDYVEVMMGGTPMGKGIVSKNYSKNYITLNNDDSQKYGYLYAYYLLEQPKPDNKKEKALARIRVRRRILELKNR